MRIFCDFDGTISTVDTTDLVLSHLADPSWEELETLWTTGRISAAECMRSQIALIGGDEAALDAVLDTVEIAEGFADFAAWCEEADAPLTIVSDGVDRFIQRILRRHGLGHLPVIANHLVGDAIGGRALEQPWMRAGCAAGSGVCKCQVVGAAPAEGMLVFIGDGRSDFCVSNRADLLFARDKLAEHARSRAMPHHEFADFHHIRATLSAVHTRRTRAAV